MKRCWALFFAFALTGLIGCSGLQQIKTKARKDAAEGQRLFARLVNRNVTLETFKGLGRATVRKYEKDYVTRLAWVGSAPGKLRVEVTGGPGLAKMGFSSDGLYLYYLRPENSGSIVTKVSSKNPTLQDFLSIPITFADIVTFLSGRIPDYAPRTIEYRKGATGQGDVLILKKEWWQNTRQEIFLNATRTDIRSLAFYSGGRLAYRVAFTKMMTVKGYRVPAGLIISDDEGGYFRLRIDRYWANAAIPPDIFVLKPPRKRGNR